MTGAACISPLAAADPSTMIVIVARLEGPHLKPGSFAALPRTMYRAGDRYARIENPPDARQGIQTLIIINEPDAWMVNLMTKRGSHAVDEGNDQHLPVVFDPSRKNPSLNGLEFGEEYDFFTDAGAQHVAGPIINAQPTDEYRLPVETGTASLVTKYKTETPIRLSWKTSEGEYSYEYIRYEERPFDRLLFAKPSGIRMREMPKDAGEEKGE